MVSTICASCEAGAALVQVTYQQPHVLLLDEPSNHLDIDAVDALIDGLNAYKGGVLMVSHDQTLIEATMEAQEGDQATGNPVVQLIGATMETQEGDQEESRSTSQGDSRKTSQGESRNSSQGEARVQET